MKAIEKRLTKVETAAGALGDVRAMSDRQLDSLICRSMTQECRAGKTFDELVAEHREAGDDDVADLIVERFKWDPARRIVGLKGTIP